MVKRCARGLPLSFDTEEDPTMTTIAELERRIEELEARLATEVRTRRIVVVDDDDVERITAGTHSPTHCGEVFLTLSGRDVGDVSLLIDEGSQPASAGLIVGAYEHNLVDLGVYVDRSPSADKGIATASLRFSDVVNDGEGGHREEGHAHLSTDEWCVGDIEIRRAR